MLTEQQLEEYFERRGMTSRAREVVRTVRSSPPTRRVKSGAVNVACRYVSRKMGLVIQAESHKNELAALVSWDFDDITHEIYDQPIRVRMQYRNKTGRLITHMSTPDFFLLQEDFTGWIECKTEEWLQARAAEGSQLYVRDADGKWRCPAGEKYAAELGLEFRVHSSAEINWIQLRNIEFLADYLDERCPPAKDTDVSRIREAMENQAWVSVKQLIDCGCDPDAVFRMVADGQLYIDLDRYLLAEPERAMVFRDQTMAEAYRIHLESRSHPAIGAVHPVKIAHGNSLLWDGKPWRILNVGDEDVFLEDEEHVITSVRKSALTEMVKDGVIAGVPMGGAEVAKQIEQIVRSASPADFEHALYRYRCLFPETSGKAHKGATARAVRKWRSRFRKSAQAFGSGFLGLLPAIHRRGNRERKIDQAVIDIMSQVINDWYAQAGGKSITVSWGEVRNICQEKGLAPPSERTFRSEIKRRSANAMTVAREGEKAAYADSEFVWWLERSTPRHGDRPFEIAHIDHTELDLQFVGARRGEKLGKAWLTLIIDAYTRMVLAWILSFDSPSYRSCMAVIRECVRRHGRVPRYIVVDKGAEFESVYFECLLARVESHKKTRPGSKPRFGSILERFFGISNEAFVHNLRGNNRALQKPRQMSASHDPRELAVWTLPDFKEAFDGFVDKVYSQLEHPALGMSPKEAMAVGIKQSGLRQHMLIPYTEDFILMCMPSTKKGSAKVDAGRGVKIDYIYYWTPEFRDPRYAKADVPVRYDPFDKSTAFVWLKNHWAMCRSELASEFQGRSEKEINEATQELRARHKRNDTRRAVNAQMIASYLREISKTEEGLRRQSRREDMRDTHDLQAVPQGLLPSPQDSKEEPSDDGWGNLNLRFFGEF